MIPQRITNTSVIAAIAIASIALVIGLSQTQTTTAADIPKGNNVYVFAEGVYPQATFEFRDAIVTYDFQAFTHINNLFGTASSGVARLTSSEFTLQRIVGETPYLHKAVDQAYENLGRATGMDYPYKLFDVTVDFVQAGQPLRTLEYGDCSVTNYRVNTEFDKEEGYTSGGKTGFAVMEVYTFTCAGYKPIATTYEQMVNEKQNHKPYE